MSEHLSVNSKISYQHLPYDEEGAFTYCNHCKETCERLTVEFHQGIGDWMRVICPGCKKTIWSSELKREQIKDNKKCIICKKPTNHYDCFACGTTSHSNKISYWCSKKCYNKGEENE